MEDRPPPPPITEWESRDDTNIVSSDENPFDFLGVVMEKHRTFTKELIAVQHERARDIERVLQICQSVRQKTTEISREEKDAVYARLVRREMRRAVREDGVFQSLRMYAGYWKSVPFEPGRKPGVFPAGAGRAPSDEALAVVEMEEERRMYLLHAGPYFVPEGRVVRLSAAERMAKGPLKTKQLRKQAAVLSRAAAPPFAGAAARKRTAPHSARRSASMSLPAASASAAAAASTPPDFVRMTDGIRRARDDYARHILKIMKLPEAKRVV